MKKEQAEIYYTSRISAMRNRSAIPISAASTIYFGLQFLKPGLYLKTLSGLRFALAHAAAWNKKRILFVAPLLTIIEQSAKEIRNYIQNDSVILEHHSNVIREDGELDFLTETWSAPIIITTLVQFLNTLFDGKTGSIRRFHALSQSVIILDEVQSVPPNILRMATRPVSHPARGAWIEMFTAAPPHSPCGK